MRCRASISGRSWCPTGTLLVGLTLFTLIQALAPDELLAQATSGTDIWAFRISGSPPTLNPESGIRITERPGYDNQPCFAPGNRLVLYTAIDSAGQADIWRFEMGSRSHENVTRSTPESEYSPTIMPDLTRFSVVRVEADSTQRLWSFESGGTNPQLLLPDIQPVGYHAWLGPDRLALFVLGNPATLQMVSLTDGRGEVVAQDIGRSIHSMPGRGTVSFVQWGPDRAGHIQEYEPETGTTQSLAPVLGDNEFYTWTPEGLLISGLDSKLYWWRPGDSEAWEEFADLEAAGILGISRIALSPGGEWIAVVAQDTPEPGR